MSTKILLRELALFMFIGIDAAERHAGQMVLLSAEVSLGAAPDGDDAPSYDYHAAVRRLRELAASKHWGLMETFADAAARELLASSAACEVCVTVCKPRALDDLAAACVEVRRRKDGQTQGSAG